MPKSRMTKVNAVHSVEIFSSNLSLVNEGKVPVDTSLSRRFDLKLGQMAESKTIAHFPCPWVIKGPYGKTLLTVSNTLITAVRAVDSSGQPHCFLNIAEQWTAGWAATKYGSNKGIPFQFSYENAQGGRLRWWDQGLVHSYCGMKNKPMNFSEAFDPGIYDVLTRGTRYFGAADFFPC